MKTVSSKIYDEHYYKKVCLGSEEFKKTQGKILHPRLKKLLSQISIKPNMKILDLGCGRGDISLSVAQKAQEVIGIDYSKSAIKIASSIKKKFPARVQKRVNFYHMNSKHLKFKENYFDLIICIDIFEHLYKPELEQAMKELSRVLKPGGILFVHTGANKILYDFTYKYYILPVNRFLTFVDQLVKNTRYKSLPFDPRTKEEKIQHVNEPTFFYLKALFTKYKFVGKIKIEIGYLKEKRTFKSALYNSLITWHPLSKIFPLSLLFGWVFICIMKNNKQLQNFQNKVDYKRYRNKRTY